MVRGNRFGHSQAWRPMLRGGWVKKARTNKPKKEWGSIGSTAPSAVFRSCAQGVPGLWGTIDRRGFCTRWGGTDGAVDAVRILAGLEAYATGWMDRRWWMGEKSAHE
jgi:hypothetical protein